MTIQSVKRSTDILSLFSSSQTALGITQIAALLSLNKATAWGLVTTLEQQGFLQQNPGTQKYSIGSKIFELGMVYFGHIEINATASRPVHELASRTGLNARVGIWDRNSVLITLLAMPKSEDSISHQLGPRIPAYCSGIGKALLAFMEPEELQAYLRDTILMPHTKNTFRSVEILVADLEKTRKLGYSISHEEMIPGLIALGAPVYGKGKRLAGAISIGGPPSIFHAKQVDKMGDELLRTATEISQTMGCYLT
jgi:DNA-binding IclR family transcriptional regulator